MSFNNVKLLALLIGLFFSAQACFGQVKSGTYCAMLKTLLSHSVPEIQVQEAARDSTGIFFLDAREPKEYAVSHINGAIEVGYDNFDVTKLPSDLARDSRIVVYCSVGYRSEKVAEKLLAAGYKNVSNLYGGIFEWVNQENPVYNDKGPTEKVHAYSRTWGVWLKKGKKVY